MIDPNSINLAGADPAADDSIAQKVLFSWEGQEFVKQELRGRWYVLAALCIVGIIGYSVWQRDWYVIGITVVVSAVLFWYAAAVRPRTVTYQITPLGFLVDDRLYPFDEMHSFWIVYNQKVKNLYIAFAKRYLPALTIDLEKIDPFLIRPFLLKKLPEQEKRGENIIDRLSRTLGL